MIAIRPPRAAVSVLKALAALAALACGAATDARAEAPKVSLTVNVDGFRNADGQALIALFDSKDTWPKLDRAVRLEKVKLTGTKLTLTFQGLPPGIYGISAVHDENANGKLDMRWFPYPKPKEGVGASNGAKPGMGPPSWSDARFRLTDKGGVMPIAIGYY